MPTICDETDAILKLDLGDKGGIRRISLAKLWDPVISRVSYHHLSDIALRYSTLSESKIHIVTVTYTDEDGDNITISTDDELTDAFEQFSTSVPPIVRAKASFKAEKNGKEIINPSEMKITSNNKICSKETKNEPVAQLVPDTRHKKVEANDVHLSPEVEEKQEDYCNILTVKADLDKGFIHGRHTCDGCLGTPIFGIRYHALNLPDHDLCEICIHKHNRKDIIFEPTELERDRYIQNKWRRREWRQKTVAGARCGMQKFDTLGNCGFDSALKEAIRRSLLDVNPEEKEKNSLTQGEEIYYEKEKVDVLMDKEDDEDVEVLADDDDDDEGEEVGRSGCLNLACDTEINEDLSYTEEESRATYKLESLSLIKLKEELTLDEDLSLDEEFAVDFTPIKTTKARESSFTADAEGQGDVAVAIGMALDVTANAIDAVVSELEKSFDDTNDEHQTKSNCVGLGSLSIINSSAKVEESSQPQSSVKSNDEWQVLHEDIEATSDEMISQAAQLLGSALFQSDIIADKL